MKINLYQIYFINKMISPVSDNYSERKLLLDILGALSPIEIELIAYLNKENKSILDRTIIIEGVEKAIVQGCISKIKMLGLVDSKLHSIEIGGDLGKSTESIRVSVLVKKFHEICMEFNN